jgi:predicted phage terminase large subunit-like protein
LPLATRFEKGQVFIVNSPSIDPDFIKEMLAFPSKHCHDDTIDAAELAFSSLTSAKPFVFSI